ncbi:hypothetical protein PINS_up011335 [Pythium insidiosum]|nr:hypothetical protein PINS_up011335 [Pythium insidiosum]
MGLDQFPVDERAVPRVRVPVDRLLQWKEVAQDEVSRALQTPHSWYHAFKDKVRDGYEPLADRPQLQAFIRDVPDSCDKNVLVRSTLFNVTLDDLAYGLYHDTTYDARCVMAHMYEGTFLDGAVLQVHERRCEHDPLHFVGMKWAALRSPAAALITSRDFVYFSYDGSATDSHGHRVLFRFLRSMPMDDIPVEDQHLPPLVRGKISNLNIYRQNGAHVDVFTKAMHSNAGNMPSWVVTKTIAFMFPGILNIETLADARALLAVGMARLNPARVTHPVAALIPGLVPGGAASNQPLTAAQRAAAILAAPNVCGVCFHKFRVTRSKRRCQSCCREVCKRCTRRLWLFDELKHLSETAVVALRFCLNCMRFARHQVRESAGAVAGLHCSQLSVTSNASSSSGAVSSHRSSRGGRAIVLYQPESPTHASLDSYELTLKLPSPASKDHDRDLGRDRDSDSFDQDSLDDLGFGNVRSLYQRMQNAHNPQDTDDYSIAGSWDEGATPPRSQSQRARRIGWSHATSAAAVRQREAMTRGLNTRHKSVPDLHALQDTHSRGGERSVEAAAARRPALSRARTVQDPRVAADLEAIFRLQSELFQQPSAAPVEPRAPHSVRE